MARNWNSAGDIDVLIAFASHDIRFSLHSALCAFEQVPRLCLSVVRTSEIVIVAAAIDRDHKGALISSLCIQAPIPPAFNALNFKSA